MALTPYTTDKRPTCTAFAFGRVWYGGFLDKKWGDTLMYSQVLVGLNRIGACHQDADPTSSEINSLVESDGGTIELPDKGVLHKLVPVSNGLVALASNGVWMIRGGSDGFSPISFIVEKITDVGAISKKTIVNVEGTIVYASNEALFQILPDPQSGKMTARDISTGVVGRLWRDKITKSEKLNASFVYDGVNKKLAICYGSGGTINNILFLSTKTGVWFKYSLGPTARMLVWQPLVTKANESGPALRMFCTFLLDDNTSSVWSVSSFHDASFVDGGDPNASYPSYIVTAPVTLGAPQFDKAGSYITTFFKKTEKGYEVDINGDLQYKYPSGCLLQTQWDWHNTAAGGKWSSKQQVYRFRKGYYPSDSSDPFDTGEDVIVTKTRIRGKGKALSLKFEAEPGKDLQLLGYTLPISMEGTY